MIFDDDDDGLGLPSLLFTSDVDSEAARELAKMLALKANMAPSGGVWDGLIYMCMDGWTEEDRRDESLGKGGVLLVLLWLAKVIKDGDGEHGSSGGDGM